MAAPATQRIGTAYGVPGKYWAAGHHTGVDYLTATGTTLTAPADSTIIHAGANSSTGWGSAYGIHVIGETTIGGRKYRWLTAHMSKVSVKKGQKVRLGDTLGKSGATGNVTGPHCHFELRRSPYSYGKDVNPSLIVAVKKAATKPSQTAVWDLPSTWAIGSTGDAVTKLGQRLAVHAKANGRPAPYKSGPGPTFTETDRAAVAAFQKAQGWSGDDADGYPGAETFRRLAESPTEHVGTVPVTAMFTPLAGYNGLTAKGVTRWKANTDGTARIVLKHAPDLLATTELSNKVLNPMKPRLVALLSPSLILVNDGSDGRYIFRNPKTTKWLGHRLVTTPKKLRFRGDDKQGFILPYQKDDARGIYAVFHAENEAGFDQGRVDQVMWFMDQVEAMADDYDVPPENALVVMDSNSAARVAEALERRTFGGRKYKVVGTANYVGWDGKSKKPFDLAVTTGDAEAKELSSEGNGDHNWLLIHHNLTK